MRRSLLRGFAEHRGTRSWASFLLHLLWVAGCHLYSDSSSGECRCAVVFSAASERKLNESSVPTPSRMMAKTSFQALFLTVRPTERHSNAACAPLNGVVDSYNFRIFRWSVGCDIWLRFPTFPNFRRARLPVEVRSEFGDCSRPASFSKSHSSRARAARLRCNVSLSSSIRPARY